MVNTREYNKKRFSIFESEEKTALELMNELGQACNEVLDRTDKVEKDNNKKVCYEELHTKYQLTTDGDKANFNGSWQGLNKPTLTQEGAAAQVEKNMADIIEINEQLDSIVTLSSINNLQETIDNSENRVFITPITHKITSTLFIKDGVYEGVRGKSIILIDDDFIKGDSLPTSEFAIVNKNFSFNHNEYANDITFKGITFLLNTKTDVSAITTILGLANVKRVIFEQCDIIAKSDFNKSHSCFDLYSSCKNVTFRDCYINLDTKAHAGGNWIRNYSSDYTGNSITDNITIDNCIFESRGKDEVLAIYGWRNTVKNVNVINCKLKRGEDYIDMSNFISIFASDISPWDNENACVENIKIINNDIDVKGVNNFIIQVGNNSEKGIIKNIFIDNNNIKVNSNCSSVIRGYTYADNINIINNNVVLSEGINCSSVFNEVTYCFNNNIEGGIIEKVFSMCNIVNNNNCKNDNANVFSYDCITTNNNKVMCNTLCEYYSLSITRGEIRNNEFETVKNGTDSIKVTKSSNDRELLLIIDSNKIDLFGDTNRFAWTNNNGTKFEIINNEINNATKDYIVYGNNSITKFGGNKINGVLDNLRTSRIDDWNLEPALPIGFTIIDSNCIVYGWQKIATGRGSDVWKTLNFD